MMDKCQLRIAKKDLDRLMQHLFPGDGDEHGAVLLAGLSNKNGQLNLCVREIHLAKEGSDYVEGKIGYRALSPRFIHKIITRARDERLVYLAVHNHASDREVEFSQVDLQSHQRGYPALLQIAKGLPVGALVFGRRSMQADIWLPLGNRLRLEVAVVVGNNITQLAPSNNINLEHIDGKFDRQIKMFGTTGQSVLAKSCVGIIGLGGIGSLVAEYLGRLGIGKFILIDPDRIEESNYSRVVGAWPTDLDNKTYKVDIAKRLILQCNDQAEVIAIRDDVAKKSVAHELLSCDYIFLAADSMRARLVFNAIVHQHFIPGVQMGSKIRSNREGTLVEVMSANRPVRPGAGCLWCNQLIDPNQLAIEAKSDDERKAQAYGVEESNPSVITLNAISAAHAVNDFLLGYLDLRPSEDHLSYEHFYFLNNKRSLVEPRKDNDCSECSTNGLRYGRGDGMELPCTEG